MKKIFIIIALFNFCVMDLYAQMGSVGTSDARSVGMGKTSTSTSRGVFSIGYNPANLLFDEDNHFEFATVIPFPNLNMRFGTNFITIKDYNYFFGGVKDESGKTVGRYLSESDKNNLKTIFSGGGFFVADFSTSIFTATLKINDEVGAFGFGINDIIAFKATFPGQLINLALEGNPIGSVYNFNDANAKGWWLRDYSLTYSRALPEISTKYFKKLSAGISFKYIQGFAYAGIDKIETSLSTGAHNEITAKGNVLAHSSFSDDFQVKYDFDSTGTKQDASVGPFPSPAGTGLGIDFGISAQLDDVWTFGLALTDIGSINWNKNVAMYSSNTVMILRDITNKEEVDSLKDVFTGKGKFVNEVSTPLPTALRIGASFQLDKYVSGSFPGSLLLALDYNQGFNDQPRNSKNPRLSLGAEWKPMNWIPYIRTGFSFGGADGFGWAFGFGFNAGILEFNFASPDFHYLFMANQAKRISLAIGSRWKF
ncbi:MAG: DUF5723 family protein [Ignavibacteriales bacterium]|nr:DUF5723 family protein [Ignavibacteriales bacterium]